MNETIACKALAAYLTKKIHSYLRREQTRTKARLRFLFAVLFFGFVIAASLVLDRVLSGQSPPNLLSALLFQLLTFWRAWNRLLLALTSFGVALGSAAVFFQQLYRLGRFRDALWHLLALMFGFRYRYLLVREGQVCPLSKGDALTKVGGPGWLIVYTDSAAVLEYNARFSRVAGSGFFPLKPFETVREVVDLRPQVRSTVVRALTKDGIPIQVALEVEFLIRPSVPPVREDKPGLFVLLGRCLWTILSRILPGSLSATLVRLRDKASHWLAVIPGRGRKGRADRGKSAEGGELPDKPYPFDERAVRRAVYNKAVDKDNVYRWSDLVILIASAQLRNILGRYVLDKLAEPEDGDEATPLPPERLPRKVIRSELGSLLRSTVRYQLGATVLRISLGPIKIDKKYEEARNVVKQRVESWQAEWARRAKVTQARGEAEALRLRELARAQAQTEMILAITQGFQTASVSEEIPLREVLALRCIEALERMTMDSRSRHFVPYEVLRTLEMMHQVIKEGDNS